MTNGYFNPFPGLRAFEPEEDYLFFGRERESDELRRRLRISRFLAVIGSSGSGKSSLVKSGLIPSLHAGFMAQAGSNWRVAALRPGESPIGNLVKALESTGVLPAMDADATKKNTLLDVTLRDSSMGVAEAVRHARLPSGDNLLVLVDQFEELFRFRRSRANGADESIAFVKLLLDAARQDYAPVFVLLTMRSEFIGDCMPFAGLPDAINEGQYLIPRMSRDELRSAITKPAAVGGAKVAPRLVVRLLNEMGDDTDALPVLQHALMRTWDVWTRDRTGAEPLDNRHYEAAGTMSAALSIHANDAYDGLQSDRLRAIAARLFKTITDTDEEGRGVRKPATLGRIAAICGAGETEVAGVVEQFRSPGRAFLQPPAGVPLNAASIIDISHESLMRLWTRLVEWTRQEARSADIYKRLKTSASLSEKGEASLWRTPELQIGLRWKKENQPTAAWAGDAQEFARSMRFLERSRRAHWMKVGAMVAAVACVIVGLAAWVYQQHAENDRLKAKLAELSKQKVLAAAKARESADELVTLRAKNAALKVDVESAKKQQQVLDDAIQALRKSNTESEQRIAAIGKENDSLSARIVSLRKEADSLEDEGQRLRQRLDSVSGERNALVLQKQRLTLEASSHATKLADLHAKATSVGYVEPLRAPLLASAPAFAQAVLAAPVIVALKNVPAEIADNDSLRRQIEELQHQLDQLQAERAKQENEASWLIRENDLLAKQLVSRLNEIKILETTRQQLAARSTELQNLIAKGLQDNQKLKQDVAAADAETTKVKQEVAALQKSVNDAQDQNNGLAADLDSLQRQIQSLEKEIDDFVKFLSPIIDRLTNGIANAPADLAGLLSVAAYRVAPYDPDDPAHPAIYNALWLALNRLDAKTARDLISPSPGGTAKVGTTNSAALAQAICGRVKRGFTKGEELTYFQSARVADSVAQPCRN